MPQVTSQSSQNMSLGLLILIGGGASLLASYISIQLLLHNPPSNPKAKTLKKLDNLDSNEYKPRTKVRFADYTSQRLEYRRSNRNTLNSNLKIKNKSIKDYLKELSIFNGMTKVDESIASAIQIVNNRMSGLQYLDNTTLMSHQMLTKAIQTRLFAYQECLIVMHHFNTHTITLFDKSINTLLLEKTTEAYPNHDITDDVKTMILKRINLFYKQALSHAALNFYTFFLRHEGHISDGCEHTKQEINTLLHEISDDFKSEVYNIMADYAAATTAYFTTLTKTFVTDEIATAFIEKDIKPQDQQAITTYIEKNYLPGPEAYYGHSRSMGFTTETDWQIISETFKERVQLKVCNLIDKYYKNKEKQSTQSHFSP